MENTLPNPFSDHAPVNVIDFPVSIMAKPAGPQCNLACEYCYYLEKKGMLKSDSRFRMTDATLEAYIRKYIEVQCGESVDFVWHGGEATLRNLDFFRRVTELQAKHAGGKKITNSLQTNGTLLTAEWCTFLRDNNWLVGISIDGPQRFHDEYRRTPAGKPTFQSVMKGIRLLQQYNVEWNAMAVVNDYNADYPEEFYRFFKNIGCRFLQFTPIVERIGSDSHLVVDEAADAEITEMSVTPEQWGAFLCRLFDKWVVSDVGSVFVQLFDATLANWVGVKPGLCTLDSDCGHAVVMEHDGDIYSCDHFVFPEFRLGNIHTDEISTMMMSEVQERFIQRKNKGLPAYCRRCKWEFACHGECPKNRFAVTPDGEAGLNYLCEGYRRFFEHVAPFMDFMKGELLAGRPAANVMKAAPEILARKKEEERRR